jgi:uncharacterized protein with NRDE domain
MCLIVFAYRTHPEFPLIVAANRDEFYARPTRAAHFWADHSDVFAGRDMESPQPGEQGTWMGINTAGRFAAVTNFREMDFNETVSRRSRGELTANFLCAHTPASEYLKTVREQAGNYKGFNLLLWDKDNLCYVSNRIEKNQALRPGIYGLSNGVLDSPWPKVLQAKQQLTALLQHSFNAETLLSVLMNRNQAADHHLPDTGIDIESERLLSPCFIQSERYGTRASTVLLVHKNNTITFLEQNWNAEGLPEARHYLELAATSGE